MITASLLHDQVRKITRLSEQNTWRFDLDKLDAGRKCKKQIASLQKADYSIVQVLDLLRIVLAEVHHRHIERKEVFFHGTA